MKKFIKAFKDEWNRELNDNDPYDDNWAKLLVTMIVFAIVVFIIGGLISWSYK